MAALKRAGIAPFITRFPAFQNAYNTLGYSKGTSVTEKVSAEIVSLPMFPGLTPGQQTRVVEQVIEFLSPTQP
jgi:dTDP-4-amino-4,6-dideoxygalactose transaminase